MKNKPRISPYILLTLAALFWSGNMVVGRALRDSPPAALTFWRWCIAVGIVLPFAVSALRKQWPLILRSWKILLLLGGLGVGSFGLVTYIGLRSTTATNASLLNSIIPVAILALSWIFLRQPLSRRQVAGVTVSLAGVLVIVTRGDADVLLALRLNPGDIWILVAVVSWAIYTLCLRWRPVELNPQAFLVVTVSIGLLGIGPIYIWEHFAWQRLELSLGVATGILYVAVFPSLLAYLFYNRGVVEVGPERAGLFLHLMPVFGTLLSVIFLGESLHLYHAAGMLMIFCGIYLSTARRIAFRQS